METKETDHKAYYVARSQIHAVFVWAYGGWTHAHKPSATFFSLHVLVWCQSHGFQLSSSVTITYIFSCFKLSTWSPNICRAGCSEVRGDQLSFSPVCVSFSLCNCLVATSSLNLKACAALACLLCTWVGLKMHCPQFGGKGHYVIWKRALGCKSTVNTVHPSFQNCSLISVTKDVKWTLATEMNVQLHHLVLMCIFSQ